MIASHQTCQLPRMGIGASVAKAGELLAAAASSTNARSKCVPRRPGIGRGSPLQRGRAGEPLPTGLPILFGG